MYRAAFILSIIGIVVLAIAIAVPFVFPGLFDSKINQKLIIKPGAPIMKTFEETPIPIINQFWFFNVTNVDGIIKGEKPVLNQIGPFTYYQYRKKENIEFHDDLGTVYFQPRKFFYFKPELSAGTEDIKITTIDPIYLSLASKLSSESIPAGVRSIVELIFLRFDKTPFMTHTIEELLFKGYEEPVLLELFKLTKDPKHKLGKFGYFLDKNGTLSEEFEIYSGQLDMSNYQDVFKWNGKSSLEFWKEEDCNMINGTDGAQFARPIKSDERLYLFSSELCRSLYAEFEKDVILGPLTLNRFILPSSLLDRTSETECYCTSEFSCRKGMINLSTCKNGSPIVASLPHFYQSNRDDQEAVEGLDPNKEEHETRIDIEPNTGVSMRVAKRLQINMPLRRYAKFPSLKDVREVIMPIFWINESIEVPVSRAEQLHVTLTLPITVVSIGSWILLAIGIILVAIAFFLTVITYKKNKALQKRRQEFCDKSISGNSSSLLEKKIYEVS
ncbi:UNVERIFIED_CONTAM: hypothetical protein RMT77_011077 [Armadillidium vulgare]